MLFKEKNAAPKNHHLFHFFAKCNLENVLFLKQSLLLYKKLFLKHLLTSFHYLIVILVFAQAGC